MRALKKKITCVIDNNNALLYLARNILTTKHGSDSRPSYDGHGLNYTR